MVPNIALIFVVGFLTLVGEVTLVFDTRSVKSSPSAEKVKTAPTEGRRSSTAARKPSKKSNSSIADKSKSATAERRRSSTKKLKDKKSATKSKTGIPVTKPKNDIPAAKPKTEIPAPEKKPEQPAQFLSVPVETAGVKVEEETAPPVHEHMKYRRPTGTGLNAVEDFEISVATDPVPASKHGKPVKNTADSPIPARRSCCRLM